MRCSDKQKYCAVVRVPKTRIWSLSNVILWTVTNKLNIFLALLALIFAFVLSCGCLSKADKSTHRHKLFSEIEHIQTKVSSIHQAIATINKKQINQDFHTIKHVDDERIDEKIRIALKTYNADKIGMIDYALESSGARILVLPGTISYNRIWSVLLWNSLGLGSNKGPETMLRPGNQPGDCFAFSGRVGSFRIVLAASIRITAVSIEHVPLETTKDIRSAPKHFDVYGRNQKNIRYAYKLGAFKYDIHGFDSIQTFQIESIETYIQVELHIQSNHGHPSYTCVYRFRVHGIE